MGLPGLFAWAIFFWARWPRSAPKVVKNAGTYRRRVVFYGNENRCAGLVQWVHKQPQMRGIKIICVCKAPLNHHINVRSCFSCNDAALHRFWHVSSSTPCAVTAALLHSSHCRVSCEQAFKSLLLALGCLYLDCLLRKFTQIKY